MSVIGHFRGNSSNSMATPASATLPRSPRGTRASRASSDGANAREDMERRYTQGAGRRGEEAEQLRVRCRLVQAVRAGLARFGRPWWELPRDLSSWDTMVPGAAAQLGPDAGDES